MAPNFHTWIILLILMILLILLRPVSGLFYGDLSINVLSTNKNYLFVGEHLTVNCTLTPEDLNRGKTPQNVVFGRQAVNGSPTSDEYPKSTCFNASSVHQLDNITAQLNVSVVPESSGVYYCYSSPGCREEDEVGFSGDVRVDYGPQEVKNFKCVVVNWESLKCTWDFPVSYVDPTNIETSLTWTSGKGPNLRNQGFGPCPSKERFSCTWNEHVFQFRGYFAFQVTVTNRKNGASVKSYFEKYINELVKPDPVIGLICTADAQKPGCMHLRWIHSAKYWPKIYRIKVDERMHGSSAHDDKFKVLTTNSTGMTYDACGFSAYSLLNFSVEAFPQGPFSGYRSTPMFCENRTAQEAPSAGPPIALGSFSSRESNDGYSLTFYWNHLDDSMTNGVIDGYVLETSDGTRTEVVGDHLSSTLHVSSSNRNPFSVSVYARNEAGISIVPSSWKINPAAMEVPESIRNSFVAKSKGSKVTLAWDNGKENTDRLMVYWCSRSSKIGDCQSPLAWREVEGSTSQYVLPQLPKEPGDYTYGVSVAKRNSNESSGIFWTQCLTRSIVPQPPNFHVNPLTSSLLVSWERDTCTYQSGFRVKHYLVKWCLQSECRDPARVLSHLIPSNQNTYTIRNVTAGADYKVTMELFSVEKQSGDAKWLEAVPTKQLVADDTDSLLVVKIVVPLVILGVIFAATGIAFV